MNPTTEPSSKLSAELAVLLERVDGIRARCARIERRLNLLLFLLAFSALLLVGALRLLLKLDAPSPFIGMGWYFALFLFISFVFVRSGVAWGAAIGELKRTKRTLSEAFRVVREIEPVIAAEEGWSVVKKAEFRLRLAEYGVEPEAAPRS